MVWKSESKRLYQSCYKKRIKKRFFSVTRNLNDFKNRLNFPKALNYTSYSISITIRVKKNAFRPINKMRNLSAIPMFYVELNTISLFIYLPFHSTFHTIFLNRLSMNLIVSEVKKKLSVYLTFRYWTFEWFKFLDCFYYQLHFLSLFPYR